MKKILILLFCVFVGISLQAQDKMSTSEISQLKTAVAKEAKKVTSLSSDFEETKHVSVLKNSSISSGVFKFKSQKLLWQYTSPKKSAMLFTGNTMKVRNDKGKTTSFDLNKNKRFRQLQQLMMSSYTGDLFDETNFTIQYFKDNVQKWAVLTPKNKDMSKHIKQVTFWFKNGENTVSEIKIVEGNNDYSIIKLLNKKPNASINDNEFQL